MTTDRAVDNAAEYRIEHDTMGEVRVPVTALWRAQTQRAVENFPISGRGLERTQIRALGLLKGACAQVNKDLGLLAPEKADAIIAAAGEIADGLHDDQFPIDVFQTGSGTSSNMNTNEVIASIAAQNGITVHPNDDVNMSQSSNDTFPTATHIAATEAAVRQLIPALEVLHESLTSKARQWRTVVKSGRTHLMDAVPVTLGQEFSGYARQVEAGIERVKATLPRLGELAIGGTALARAQRPEGSARRSSRFWFSRPVSPIANGGELFRSPGRPRRAGRGIWRTAHDRGLADQDRQ
jgi:fumarate hydratase class II